MSSSEGENFEFDNISGPESDDYSPVKKSKVSAKPKAPTKAPAKLKAPAKSKAPATKAAAKPKAASKKVLVDHDENGEDSVVEKDEHVSENGVVPLPVKEDSGAPGKKKTASETYVKLSQLEHIM
ncbi:hypothetical protein E4T56_gene5639, partial [Termitomyces sp. T112]